MLQGVSVIFAGISMALAGYLGSRGLHKKLLSNILRSPMSFFDTTPLGRILNRFSKDINNVDEVLTSSFSSFLNCIYTIIATVIAVIIATPTFLIVIVPMAVFYASVQVMGVNTNK